jgi:hypothetical protein
MKAKLKRSERKLMRPRRLAGFIRIGFTEWRSASNRQVTRACESDESLRLGRR